MSRRVEFYISMGSRYSYLAFSQLERLRTNVDAEIDVVAIDSGSLISRKTMDPFKGQPSSGQYDWAYRQRDAERWADYYGVPFNEPRGRLQLDTLFLAVAVTAAKRLGEGEAFARGVFRAIFQSTQAGSLGRAEFGEIALACGLDASAFFAAVDAPETATEHAANIQRAHAQGVFGVPTWVVHDTDSEAVELFWGNDRLVLLEHTLQRAGALRIGKAHDD